MICYKKQKKTSPLWRCLSTKYIYASTTLRLNILILIKTVFIHDTNVSNHLVSNHYCAALSTVVGAVVGVAAGIGVALNGIAKYF